MWNPNNWQLEFDFWKNQEAVNNTTSQINSTLVSVTKLLPIDVKDDFVYKSFRTSNIWVYWWNILGSTLHEFKIRYIDFSLNWTSYRVYINQNHSLKEWFALERRRKLVIDWNIVEVLQMKVKNGYSEPISFNKVWWVLRLKEFIVKLLKNYYMAYD